MKKQLFIKRILKQSLLLAFLLICTINLAYAQKKAFTLWQLPSQVNTIGNSYVIQTHTNKIIVMDGGMKDETLYLRGFLAALGNEVEAWFVSHPHADHIGALTQIMQSPQDVKINNIYYSPFSEEHIDMEPGSAVDTRHFFTTLKESGIKTVAITEPGYELKIDKILFKILTVTDENLKANPYNNSSMVIKVSDKYKSILFLGDLGLEAGDRLLHSEYRKDLDCDYLQMAHHGQRGVSKDFYRTIKFRACLWPSPTWVFNNDVGKGYNTHEFETVEIRELMKELGITEHYVSNEGLVKIR